LILIVLVLSIAGCGDDGGNGDNGGGDNNGGGVENRGTPPPTPPGPTGDQGCEDSPSQPNRASSDARGFVIACLSDDRTSVRVTNVSAHVLNVNSTQGISRIEPAGVKTNAGVQAALGVTGIGWTPNRTHFVLPLGGSLLASGPGPATVLVRPDLTLTAEANTARYVADWMTSVVQSRGQALARRVEGCAQTAASYAQQNEYIEDVIRNTLGTTQCIRSLEQALRDDGRAPAELPRARSAIIGIARPVAEDRLISFTARILAR